MQEHWPDLGIHPDHSTWFHTEVTSTHGPDMHRNVSTQHFSASDILKSLPEEMLILQANLNQSEDPFIAIVTNDQLILKTIVFYDRFLSSISVSDTTSF